jgi:putative spermidine/putrescine transport system permease protein
MTTVPITTDNAPAERVSSLWKRVTLTSVITWFAAGCFVAVLLAVLFSVVVQAFATSWRGGWWPSGLTTDWLKQAHHFSQFTPSIVTTFEVAAAVVFLALLLGVPAGYVLARRSFPGRAAVMLLILLPVVLPTLTYAVQLAALMYWLHLGGSLLAVILVNLVPVLPLVVLITVPFVEQISPQVESAARVFGANNLRLFKDILVPLLTPGILAAGVLAFVRVLACFDLTFFVAGAKTQTLVVTIFGEMSDPGGPPPGRTAAMTLFYMAVAFIGLAISVRFSNPAQALTAQKKR